MRIYFYYLSIITLLTLLSPISNAVTLTPCWQTPENLVISRSQWDAVLKSIYKEDPHVSNDKTGNNKNQAKNVASEVEDEEDGISEIINIYTGDIYNDGSLITAIVRENEYSKDNQFVSFYKKTPQGLEYIKSPLAQSGEADVGDAFVTKLCGKTYLSYHKLLRNGHMITDSFIIYNHSATQRNATMQDVTMQPACDSDWANYTRKSIKNNLQKNDNPNTKSQLYIQQLWDHTKCKETMGANESLWLRNDIAYSALNLNDPVQAMRIIEQIYKDHFFAATSNEFKNALAENKAKIAMALKHLPKVILEKPAGKQAYSWLFEKNLQKPESRDRLYELFCQDVPNIPLAVSATVLDGNNICQHREDMNEFEMNSNMFLYPLGFTHNRYFWFTHHIVNTRGLRARSWTRFIWIDTALGTSVVGLCNGLFITSKYYNHHTIPEEAKKTIAKSCIGEYSYVNIFFDADTQQQIPVDYTIMFPSTS